VTTFQDPPPQSRRSARQAERGEQDVAGHFSGEPTFAQQPAQGRRARAAEPYDGAPEPLTYSTQGQIPVDYGQTLPPAGYAPAPQEPAGYRMRDFSPEGAAGRRAAAPPLVEPPQPEASAAPSDLDYRTQGGQPAPAPSATGVQPTLSRRELRQRQEAEAAAANLTTQSMPPVGAPAPQGYAAPAQPYSPPQQYSGPQPTVAPQYSGPQPTVAPQYAAPPQAAPLQTAPPQPAPGFPAAPPPMGQPASFTAPPPAAQPAPPQTNLSSAMAEFEALQRTGQSPVQAAPPQQPSTQTGGWVAPVGHWSRQADLDDETQPWENTITREVGGGNVATTTSALVLPEIPRPNPFPTALDSTGEVLLTGSIDLPPSLSTGGGDPRRYDDSQVDLMYDTRDAEFSGTDSSPVRAVRAVSTHTSSRGVIHANKPHGNRLLVVVFIATAALAVGVVGLLVASLMLDVL
jgi:hypothetical protein